jgi:RNA polymerase sigma-70 factor, ECF subfamily
MRRTAAVGVINHQEPHLKAQVLFTAHRDGVFRYLSRIVGPHDATDLTQEVFLRVSRSAVPETTADGERAWVFRIARNLALNHRRDTGRRPETVALSEAARPAPQETSTAMKQALDRLSALDRDIFLLREVAGLSYEEIAGSCEISHAAVRARLHRARQQLREELRPQLKDASPRLVRLYEPR